ncbi:hypothetical protein D6851_06425 [Altericroceibacterium spongiae]|uniref:Uncharacterized protein n=1 Tax=Altericroceibacterium spongiae TaxID=2320269 RepID=A0A420ELV2_9SPHN|nr:hypothetical protein [Altericroceibacterium spongiae]RKF21669.1 hypothetical protein D6851_06425 [Altericroceibacterium spongiae]
MERKGDEFHVSTDEARGGSTPNVTRWVLIISVVLAIILLSASWMLPALTDEEADAGLSSGAMIPQTGQNAQNTDNDGVLLDDGPAAMEESSSQIQEDDGLEVIEN